VAGPKGGCPLAPKGGRSLRGHALRDLGPATHIEYDTSGQMPTLFTTDSIETLRRNIVAALPHIAAGVAVIVVFWLLAVVTRWIVCRVSTGKRIEPALVRLMGKVAYIGLIITGLIMGLGTMGVNVSALVAGLGLTGFALGFALKDIISNLLAGVLVML